MSDLENFFLADLAITAVLLLFALDSLLLLLFAAATKFLTVSTLAAVFPPRRRFDEFFRRDAIDPDDVKLALLPTLRPSEDFLFLLLFVSASGLVVFRPKNGFRNPNKLPNPELFVTVGGAVAVAAGAVCCNSAKASRLELDLSPPLFIFS